VGTSTRALSHKASSTSTIIDYEAVLRNWTKDWLKRPAPELTRSDGRDVFRQVETAGRSTRFRRGLKYTINMIYSWGIEERFILGVHQSAVFGLDIDPKREEKTPEILTTEEIRSLLRLAQEQSHSCYPIWVGSVLTGCRSDELHQPKEATSKQYFLKEPVLDEAPYTTFSIPLSISILLYLPSPRSFGDYRRFFAPSDYIIIIY
jgi:integrase